MAEPIRRKELRKERLAKGLCSCCGTQPPQGFSTCEKWRKYQLSWRVKNREKLRQRQNKKRIENRADIRIAHKRWRDALKREVIFHYGGKCACCFEDELSFLTIDHVNNDGAAHRKELFGNRKYAGQRFYSWLRINSFPENFQVLCYNCNIGKSLMGICPHKRGICTTCKVL